MIARKIGTKKISIFRESQALNKWFERPACTEPAYPMSGALTKYNGNPTLTKVATGSIGYLKCPGYDSQNARGSFFVSGCVGNGHGISITPDVLNKSLITFSVLQLLEHSWTNDRDQFRQPAIELPEDFITDCTVWDLFHGSNQTSSLKDVEYKGKTYQVRNQFFPYLLSELREWDTPHDLSGQLRTAQDTFVANWLKGRALSAEAQALLDAGRKVYQVFYKEWKNLNLRKFKIDYWDCGWYQIRNALLDAKVGLEELNAVKEAHTKLALKLRPKVYEYGFLDQEILCW